MMGGGSSHERRPEETPEETHKRQQQCPDTDSAGPAASEDTPGELPQCRMGNRKVDDMCFMISCTNWY